MAQPAVHGDSRRTHFLVAAYGIQGHLNPARALARRLAAAGRPVTCVVCRLNMPTVVQVARACARATP